MNPVRRDLASRVIRTDVPMIDVFNTLVGESEDPDLLGRRASPTTSCSPAIGVQADADVVVFGGIGLIYDDFHMFRSMRSRRPA